MTECTCVLLHTSHGCPQHDPESRVTHKAVSNHRAIPDQESETPLTDAVVLPRLDFTNDESVYDAYKALTDHARQLERELSALTARERDALPETVAELMLLKSRVEMRLQHLVLGDPSKGVTVDAQSGRIVSTGGS